MNRSQKGVLMMNAKLLLPLVLAVALTGAKTKIDSCGFDGNIHDCQCARRTDAIRQKVQVVCDATSKTEKERDACLKANLKDHCSIAERPTQWDQSSDEEYTTYPEGDDAKSNMGPYCKHSCQPHRCQCTEESCNFGLTQEQIDEANGKK